MIKKNVSRCPLSNVLGLGLTLTLPLILGCATLQTASTDVHVDLPDGRRITYNSSKNQQGIDLEITEIDPATGKIKKKWRLRVQKSGTPEAAYSALTKQQESLADLMKAFIPLVEKAASVAPGM